MIKFIKKSKKLVNSLIILILFYILALPAWAGYLKPEVFNNAQEETFVGQAGYNNVTQYSFAKIVGTVIQAFLSLLGIIFVALILYAGYNWMMAQGEEDKVIKAKDTLKRAIIGLAITVGAYAISFWVVYRLIIKT